MGKLEASKKPRGQQEASKKPARGQQEASKRPGRGTKWGTPRNTFASLETLWKADFLENCSGGVLLRDALAGCSAS